MPAKYPLEEVKKYVKAVMDQSDCEKVVFCAPKRSLNCVVMAFMKLGKPISIQEAQDYILKQIDELTPDDFMRQMGGQWGEPKLVADQYGIRKDGIPWFIKFLIPEDEEYLDEISFHPAEKDMVLENKRTISKEWETQ